MDFTQSEPTSAVSGELASWHCDAGLWKEFRASELRPYSRSTREGKYWLIGGAILWTLLLFGVAMMAILRYRSWLDQLGPAIGVTALSSVFILSGLIMFIMRGRRDVALATETGEVTIGYDGVTLNSYQHDWSFSGKGWLLAECVRRPVAGSFGTTFQILDFSCKATMWTGRSHIPVDANWRVPVPADKIAMADQVLDRLRSRIGDREI